MFENPKRGRQARNFITNAVPKILDLKSSCEQVFSKNCRPVPLGVSGRLKDFCLPGSPLHFVFFSFLFFFQSGPDEQLCVAFTFISHNIWKKIFRKVYNYFLWGQTGKQLITYFATNNYNPIFHYTYKRWYSNLQLFS